MKKLNNLWIIVAAVMIALSSCYKEGPAISLRAKKDRLANEWVCTDYTIDGQAADAQKKSFYIGDSLTLVLNISRSNTYNMNMQYTKAFSDKNNGALLNLKTNFTNKLYIVLMGNLTDNNVLWKNISNGGKWSFADKFRKVEFSSPMGDLAKADGQKLFTADVVMLKNDNIKLQYDLNGKSHAITFEPLNKEIVK
jgi:hypothetical protein